MSDITLAIGVQADGAVQSVNALSDALSRLSTQGSGALDITGKISQAWRGGDSFGGISQQFDRLNGSIQQVSQSIDQLGQRFTASSGQITGAINSQTTALKGLLEVIAQQGTAANQAAVAQKAAQEAISQSSKAALTDMKAETELGKQRVLEENANAAAMLGLERDLRAQRQALRLAEETSRKAERDNRIEATRQEVAAESEAARTINSARNAARFGGADMRADQSLSQTGGVNWVKSSLANQQRENDAIFSSWRSQLSQMADADKEFEKSVNRAHAEAVQINKSIDRQYLADYKATLNEAHALNKSFNTQKLSAGDDGSNLSKRNQEREEYQAFVRKQQADAASWQKEQGDLWKTSAGSRKATEKELDALAQSQFDNRKKSIKETLDGYKENTTAVGNHKAAVDELTKSYALNGGQIREMMVILHEFGTGQDARIPGSLFVLLAERGFSLTNAVEAMAAATEISAGAFGLLAGTGVAAVATLATIGAAAAQTGRQMTELKIALKASGGGVGLTAGQIDQMAVSASSHVASSNYRAIANDAMNQGNIGPAALQNIMGLTANYAAVTGQDAEEAGKALVKMFENPAAAAKKLDDAYHILGYSEVEFIHRLQEAGNLEGAQAELASKLNTQYKGLADEGLNWVGRRLRDAAEAWKFYYDAAGNIGKSSSSETSSQISDRIAAAKTPSSLGGESSPEQIAALNAKLQQAQKQEADAQSRADLASANRQISAGMALANQAMPFEQQQRAIQGQIDATQRALDENERYGESVRNVGGDTLNYERQAQSLYQTLGALADKANSAQTAFSALRQELSHNTMSGFVAPGEERQIFDAMDAARKKYESDPSVRTGGVTKDQFVNAQADIVRQQQANAARDAAEYNNAQADINEKIADAERKHQDELVDKYRREMSVLQQTHGRRPETAQVLGSSIDRLTASQQGIQNARDDRREADKSPSSKGEDATARILAQADAEKKLADAWATGNVAEVHRVELEKAIALASVGKTDEQKASIDAAMREADASKQLLTAEQHRYAQMQQMNAANQNMSYLGMGEDAAKRAKAENDVTKWYRDQYGAIADLNPEIRKVYEDELARADAIANQTIAYEQQKAALDELGKFGDQVFDRMGTAITQAFTQGNGAAINFKSILQGIQSEITQELLKLAVINPIKNYINGGSSLPMLTSISNAFGLSSSGSSAPQQLTTSNFFSQSPNVANSNGSYGGYNPGIQVVGGSTPGMLTSATTASSGSGVMGQLNNLASMASIGEKVSNFFSNGYTGSWLQGIFGGGSAASYSASDSAVLGNLTGAISETGATDMTAGMVTPASAGGGFMSGAGGSTAAETATGTMAGAGMSSYLPYAGAAINSITNFSQGNTGAGIGSLVGGIAGAYFGPIGSMAGSMIGGMIGGLFDGGSEHGPAATGSIETGGATHGMNSPVNGNQDAAWNADAGRLIGVTSSSQLDPNTWYANTNSESVRGGDGGSMSSLAKSTADSLNAFMAQYNLTMTKQASALMISGDNSNPGYGSTDALMMALANNKMMAGSGDVGQVMQAGGWKDTKTLQAALQAASGVDTSYKALNENSYQQKQDQLDQQFAAQKAQATQYGYSTDQLTAIYNQNTLYNNQDQAAAANSNSAALASRAAALTGGSLDTTAASLKASQAEEMLNAQRDHTTDTTKLAAVQDQEYAQTMADAAAKLQTVQTTLAAKGMADLGQVVNAAWAQIAQQGYNTVLDAAKNGQDVSQASAIAAVDAAKAQLQAVISSAQSQISVLQTELQQSGSLRDAVTSMQDSRLTPQQAYDTAISRFQTTLTAAQGGNLDALGKVTAYGQAAVNAESTVYGGTQTTVFDQVTTGLAGLADQIDAQNGIQYDAAMAQLNALQTIALNTQKQLTASTDSVSALQGYEATATAAYAQATAQLASMAGTFSSAVSTIPALTAAVNTVAQISAGVSSVVTSALSGGSSSSGSGGAGSSSSAPAWASQIDLSAYNTSGAAANINAFRTSDNPQQYGLLYDMISGSNNATTAGSKYDFGTQSVAYQAYNAAVSPNAYQSALLTTVGNALYGSVPSGAQIGALYYLLLNGPSSKPGVNKSDFSSNEAILGISGFASGGDFGGGLRIVGERGPELEATGPARIWNADQTRRIVGGDNSDLLAELQALRAEVAALRQATAAGAMHVADTVSAGNNRLATAAEHAAYQPRAVAA